MRLENYILDLINGKRRGILASIIKFILLILSFFFQLAAKIRNFGFDSGLLCKYRPPVPLVISIGNIVAGGTGKTPATIFIAEEFYQEFKIAILSRGYRSPAEKQPLPIILSQGQGPLYAAPYCGDEPYLIAENLKKAIVLVGKNRHHASNIATKLGAQIILLDDGMQHRQMARDLEVVVMDVEDPFGKGYFLPRGLLRDEINSLSRANLIILNHVTTQDQFTAVKMEVSKYTKAAFIGCQLQVTHIYDLKNKEIESIDGKKVGLFCAIAKPEKFKQTVLAQGADVLAEFFIPDHLEFNPVKLKNFCFDCIQRGIEILVCTEKDKVKLSEYLDIPLPVAWLKIKLKLVEGDSEWKTFIQKAKQDILRQI